MNYVEIARFESRLEAETIGHALDQYDIAFLIQSHDIGMFGPGHMGRTPGGAGLLVPADRAEEASKLLHCVVQPPATVEDASDTESDVSGERQPAADEALPT